MRTVHDAAMACNRRGIELTGQCRWTEAMDCFRRAVSLQPELAAAQNNLGSALFMLGRHAEAVECYRAALKIAPHDPRSLNSLGNALRHLKQLDAAVECGREAVRLAPDFAEAHSNLGLALDTWGDQEAALIHCRKAVQLRPDFPEGWSSLALVLRGLGQLDEAVAAGRELLRLRPKDTEAGYQLGQMLMQQDRWDEACALFQSILQQDPDRVDVRISLADGLWRQDRLAEALEQCDDAVRRRPQLATTHNARGAIVLKYGRYADALASFDRALQNDADFAEAHFNRAMVLLVQGRLEEGWRDYEWRWRCKRFVARPSPRPFWDGTPLQGRSIVLAAEQGLGDTLQFVRYAPLVKQRGGEVTVVCPFYLLPLLSRCAGIDRLVAREGHLPDCDAHTPLLNLPALFGTTLTSIPGTIPYLYPDNGLVCRWRNELARLPGFKIGIAWQGNRDHPMDPLRSVPLAQFTPLARQGVHLISLQKGEKATHSPTPFALVDWSDRLDMTTGAFMDTAAIMKSLDLVITTDTAIAHLAGGLGVPVWVALAYVPDWRWLLDRDDTPWYPTMRLFRQRSPQRWDDVFARMATELAQIVVA